VIDEGGAIVEDIFPGVDGPIAVVGVSEKGTVSVDLTVKQEGGHASTPPRLSATARLARAILEVNDRPFPREFSPTTLEMIRTLGTHARQPYRWVFTHLGFTRGFLLALFARLGDETNAMIRTTRVVTRLSASEADNVLAESATATVNVRIAITSSVAEAVAQIRNAVRDASVEIAVRGDHEPSPVSPTSGTAWDAIAATVDEVFPGTIVTPYVQLGASDGRYFTAISDHVYRFTPFELSREERNALHAANERIHVATWLRGIDFYAGLIRRL
jgi:carboxypeptidase PM20D1